MASDDIIQRIVVTVDGADAAAEAYKAVSDAADKAAESITKAGEGTGDGLAKAGEAASQAAEKLGQLGETASEISNKLDTLAGDSFNKLTESVSTLGTTAEKSFGAAADAVQEFEQATEGLSSNAGTAAGEVGKFDQSAVDASGGIDKLQESIAQLVASISSISEKTNEAASALSNLNTSAAQTSETLDKIAAAQTQASNTSGWVDLGAKIYVVKTAFDALASVYVAAGDGFKQVLTVVNDQFLILENEVRSEIDQASQLYASYQKLAAPLNISVQAMNDLTKATGQTVQQLEAAQRGLGIQASTFLTVMTNIGQAMKSQDDIVVKSTQSVIDRQFASVSATVNAMNSVAQSKLALEKAQNDYANASVNANDTVMRSQLALEKAQNDYANASVNATNTVIGAELALAKAKEAARAIDAQPPAGLNQIQLTALSAKNAVLGLGQAYATARDRALGLTDATKQQLEAQQKQDLARKESQLAVSQAEQALAAAEQKQALAAQEAALAQAEAAQKLVEAKQKQALALAEADLAQAQAAEKLREAQKAAATATANDLDMLIGKMKQVADGQKAITFDNLTTAQSKFDALIGELNKVKEAGGNVAVEFAKIIQNLPKKDAFSLGQALGLSETDIDVIRRYGVAVNDVLRIKKQLDASGKIDLKTNVADLDAVNDKFQHLESAWQLLKQEFAGGLGLDTKLKSAEAAAAEFAANVLDKMTGLVRNIKNVWDAIPEAINRTLSDIKSIWFSAWSEMAGTVAKAFDAVGFASIGDKLRSLADAWKKTADDAAKASDDSAKKIADSWRGSVEAISQNIKPIKIDTDVSEGTKKINELGAELTKLNAQKWDNIKIGADNTDVLKKIDETARKLNDLQKAPATSVPLQPPDTSSWLDKIKTAVEAAKLLLGKMFDTSAKADEFDQQLNKMAAEAAKAGKEIDDGLKVQPDIDTSKMESDAAKAVSDIEQKFTEIKPQIDVAPVFQQLASLMTLDFSGLVAGLSNASQAASKLAETSFEALISGIDNASTAFRNMADAANEAASAAANAMSAGGGAGGGFAGGGLIRGPGGGTSDSVLSWLSNGEFVMRAAAVQKYGVGLFDLLNNLRLPLGFFRDGGLNQISFSPRLAIPAFAGGGVVRGSTAQSTRTLNLTIGNQTFSGLTAPENVAKQLERAAISRQTTSTGTRPRWYR